MDWKEKYKDKLVSAEEAAQQVKSGDSVAFTAGREGFAIGLALAARKEQLKGVKVFVPTPGHDFGWYDEGWQDSFSITIMYPTAVCQDALDKRRCEFNFGTTIPFFMIEEMVNANVVITEVSPPDDKGFCSFGQSLWNKRKHVAQAKLVLAEVNENLIRTYGDNYVHISDIDYLVEHISPGGKNGTGSMAGRALKEPQPYIKDICKYVSELIRDGDTIEIGIGRTTEWLVGLGLLDGKNDIGFHSEATIPGIINLVKKGVINGKRKTINKGRVVVTSLGGGTMEEMEWASNNPLFWLADVEYVEDIRTIAAHDNMVAINNALAVDFTGQIAAESLGTRLIGIAGGQIPFVFGSKLSKGGRSIMVFPSTASGGEVSRIVPAFAEGTAVTIQRNIVDYVVTEYGIASLWGKSVRERTRELINIAHPKFRDKLRKKAKKLYWEV